MFGHSIGYWIVDFFFGFDPRILILQAIVGCVVVGKVPDLPGLIRQVRAGVMHRYWLSKANIRTVGRMQRDYIDDQAAIWRRYTGMKNVSVDWRRQQLREQSRERRARHEHALAQIRKAVRDE